ncbi:hypothetical protein OUZ56_009195 [Daphnia magna]|uniref:Ionotropic glutamate receptor C-terminal domain-containing protein n=1 Tax=Daphnia magna TaxID=35525 RepID=A0ABR0AFA6_9CRUS|nr:hypothetical protein OUZ56_009195 [Daphnia magna]
MTVQSDMSLASSDKNMIKNKAMNKTRLLIVFFTLSFTVKAVDYEGTSTSTRLQTSLKGRVLRVVTGQFFPVSYVLRNSSGQIEYGGFLHHQIQYMSQKLKFTYEVYLAAENTNGIKRNGTWSGLIGALLRDEADLGLAPFAINLERYEAIEFSGLLGGDYTGILVRYPEAIVSSTSPYDVFSYEVWIGILISIVSVVSLFIALTHAGVRFFTRDKNNETKVGTQMLYVLSTITSQGGYFRSRQSSLYVLAATWCFAAFVFVNIYNSTLVSYMSVIYQKPEINSFGDLAASSYKTTVSIGSISHLEVNSAKSGDMKTVADAIERCSDCKKHTAQDVASAVVEKENYAGILTFAVGYALMQNYNTGKQCRLTMAKEKTAWKHMYYAVPKTSPYTEEINREALWFLAFGLRDYLYKKYETEPAHCQLRYNNKGVSTKSSSNPIKLVQFYLPFLILFVGYAVACFQFCIEKFYYPTRQRKLQSCFRG